jgi:hypothetical protein
MGAWDAVLTSVAQRGFAAARHGDRAAEAEAMRQFDLLVEFGGATDWVTSYDAVTRRPPGLGKA